jgi:hypothetical protein
VRELIEQGKKAARGPGAPEPAAAEGATEGATEEEHEPETEVHAEEGEPKTE